MWQQTLSILILSKAYPASGYNLAHIPRHARHLAGGYFAERATKVIPYFHYFSSSFLYKLTHIYYFHRPTIAITVRQAKITPYAQYFIYMYITHILTFCYDAYSQPSPMRDHQK